MASKIATEHAAKLSWLYGKRRQEVEDAIDNAIAVSSAPVSEGQSESNLDESIEWLKKVYSMGVSEGSVVPQQNAGEMLARLDELGFGNQEPRRGNTLWAMVMDAADEIERLRAATPPSPQVHNPHFENCEFVNCSDHPPSPEGEKQ